MDIFLYLVSTPCKTQPLLSLLYFRSQIHIHWLATGLSLLFPGLCFSIELNAVVYTLAYIYVPTPVVDLSAHRVGNENL